MSIVFLLIAFAGAFLASFPSFGWGFLAVLALRYFNGVIPANSPQIFRTFNLRPSLRWIARHGFSWVDCLPDGPTCLD